MSQRSPSQSAPTRDQHLRHRVAQRRRVRVELDDVGPGREVRIAPPGEDPAAGGPDERLRVLGQLLLGPGDEAFRQGSSPGVVGRHVIGHVVEDQADPAALQRSASRPQGAGASEALIDDVVADAVGRADHILRAQVGQGGAHSSLETGVGHRDAKSLGAALPHSHQPHRVDRQRGKSVPLGLGNLVEGERASARAAEALEPHRGVDLVDGGPRGQAHGLEPYSPTAASGPAGASISPASRNRSATVPVQPV